MSDDKTPERDPDQPQTGETGPAASSDSDVTSSETPRRNFLVEGAAVVIGGVVTLVPLLAGMLFFLDPLIRRRKGDDTAESSGGDAGGVEKDADGFLKTNATVDSLPADGSPLLVTVYDDRVDAWNRFPNQPIGTVWLRRDGEGGVQAFNTVCPHLGCSISFRNAETDFFCPCHNSTFALDGEKQNQIPPRNMDPLEVRLKEETGDAIWLKYQNYRAATHERIPV